MDCNDKAKPFCCYHCSTRTAYKGNLARHIRRKHSNLYPENFHFTSKKITL